MKLKVPPLVIFFFSILMVFACHYLFPKWSFVFAYQTIASRFFMLLGVVSGFLGITAFRSKGTTVSPHFPEQASHLIQTSVYNISRNPMYLGMALVLVGGIIRMGNPFAFIAFLFYVWYMTYFQIKPEEEALEKLFGQSYLDYKAKVRRWI